MSRSLGVVFLVAIGILVGLVGCAGSRGVAAQQPTPAKTSPAVAVAGASEAPAVSPTPLRPVVTRGAPVTAYDGERDEIAFYAPVSLALREGRFDLIIHFHGKHQTTIDALEQSGLPAAVVNVDLSVDSTTYRSSHYRDAYEDAAALDHLIAFAERELRRSGRAPGASVGRIAISAWSAGYGAAREIVQRPTDAARVDALLLVDGFYGDWENKRTHKVDPEGLEAAMEFARRASTGEKLFVYAHTAIDYRSYAGGHHTAEVLLRFLELEKGPVRPGQHRMGGAPQYAVDLEGLHVLGFGGKKFSDHVEQHRAMGTLHYAELRKYWERPPAQ